MIYPLDWKLISLIFRAFTKSYSGLENIEKNQAYIFAANHIGLIDSPFIASALIKKQNHRIHFFAKEELIKKYGEFITKKIFQFVPVYWAEPSKSISEASAWLKRGESVAIFPEGKRNTNPTLNRGKTGVARLALVSHAPVVPIGYSGPIPSNLNDDFWRDALDFFLAHQPIIIKVGKPIYFPEYYNQLVTKELLQTITAEIMQQVSLLCGKPYIYNS